MKNTTDVLLYAKVVIILKNTKTHAKRIVGIVRIELTKDLHNPFSSKELLERQDCCESTLFYTSFDSVSLPPRNSHNKACKTVTTALGSALYASSLFQKPSEILQITFYTPLYLGVVDQYRNFISEGFSNGNLAGWYLQIHQLSNKGSLLSFKIRLLLLRKNEPSSC